MAVSMQELGISGLSVKEKLDLVQQILDSLPAEVQLDELPEWHLDILALRRVEMEASPGAGKPWREALAKFGRTS